jgi:hypothetical protein
VRRRDKAQKALDKAVAAEAAAKTRAADAQEEALLAIDAVREARQLLGQETATLAELQEALAKGSAAKAKAAGYRAPATEPELLVPGAAALLAGCVDPKVHEALAYVQAQLQARQREAAAAEQREREREHQAAEEADAATAAWREEMAVGDAEANGAGQQGIRDNDEVLKILLATRQQCLRDPEARAALLQLHAGARSDGGGQHGDGWQQQLGVLFADGSKAKRQRKEDELGVSAERGA